MKLYLEENTFDDHNFYMRFISSQILWRNTLRHNNKEEFSQMSEEQLFYDFSIINATGIRASGATSAIKELFDTKNDIYVGLNGPTCMNFKNHFENKNVHFLNFSCVGFDNTNCNDRTIARKINKYFEDNDIELMKMNVTAPTWNSKRKEIKFDQIDIEDISEEISDFLMYDPHNHNDSLAIIQKLRGKKLVDTVVYIDIGQYSQREFSVRVNRLMKYLQKHIGGKQNLIFVLT